jgi:hypothetical protein
MSEISSSVALLRSASGLSCSARWSVVKRRAWARMSKPGAVSRVRVGVEDALDHHLAQQGVEEGACECLAVANLLGGRDLAQRPALQALHDEHVRGAQRPIRLRDPNRPQRVERCRRIAIRSTMSKSHATTVSMPGRRTLTTTR